MNRASTKPSNLSRTTIGARNTNSTNSSANSRSRSSFRSEGNTKIEDITRALNKVTLDSKPIISKR